MLKPKDIKMRPIEMAVCERYLEWSFGMIVEIPNDTPEDKVEAMAIGVVLGRHPRRKGQEMSHVWMYNSMDDSRPE